MKRKYEKGTEKIRWEPPVFEFEGEVTLNCGVGNDEEIIVYSETEDLTCQHNQSNKKNN